MHSLIKVHKSIPFCLSICQDFSPLSLCMHVEVANARILSMFFPFPEIMPSVM